MERREGVSNDPCDATENRLDSRGVSEQIAALHFQPLNASNFGKELRKSFPKVKRTQRTVHGHRTSVYLGVAYPLPVDDHADPELIAKLTAWALVSAA
jgi:hypothetical protein